MIEVRALSRDAFAPFGDVLDVSHPDRFEINDGFTTRVHDRFEPALLGAGPRVLVNFFLGRPRPLEAVKLERHPPSAARHSSPSTSTTWSPPPRTRPRSGCFGRRAAKG